MICASASSSNNDAMPRRCSRGSTKILQIDRGRYTRSFTRCAARSMRPLFDSLATVGGHSR